jgi:hypothetical protein
MFCDQYVIFISVSRQAMGGTEACAQECLARRDHNARRAIVRKKAGKSRLNNGHGQQWEK